MARCGRCGLWNKYPDNHHEQKHAGVCIWYQMRLQDDDVWKERKCKDFFERMPGFHAMDHFDYKVKRDNLGDAFVTAKRARIVAYVSLGISLTGLALKLLSE
jgi:hypothetical protein